MKLCLQTVLIKPEELEAHGIPVQKVVQHPGDFIINFPGQLSMLCCAALHRYLRQWGKSVSKALLICFSCCLPV